MEVKRKEFLELALKATALTIVGWPTLRMAIADDHPSGDIFIHVFLRGGCDALNFVTPLDGPDRAIYEAERQNLKMNATGDGALLKLNNQFGLHPSATGLFELFTAKKMAIVHAVGHGVNNRSHFDSQNIMDLGLSEKKNSSTGWLTRYLQEKHIGASLQTIPAVNIGRVSTASLLSYNDALTLTEPQRMNLTGDQQIAILEREILERIYKSQMGWLHRFGTQALSALDLVEAKIQKDYKPKTEYPKSDLGNRLKTLAQMIKMDVGIQVGTVDFGGWDTHKNQGAGLDGTFAKQVEQLSQALSAFYQDITDKRVTIVVQSEFGRRLRENASRGTDHGHGGLMFILGENVKGGKVYGRWPGLATEQLYERADLAVTTDYRQVLSEVLFKRLGVQKIDSIFPGFSFTHSLGVG